MSDETTTTPETQEWTFDRVWDDFVSQLIEARKEVKEKEDELEKNSSLMTRIDLSEVNEALDIVRTKVIGVESRIKREDS